MRHMTTGLVLVCVGTSLAVAQGSPDGEKWKITSSMQMSGMSMPGMTSEICKQPGNEAVPVKVEDNCQVYDVSRSGNVQSFKMRCTGKDAMEGSGQFTYLGPDHYQGKIAVNAQGESMTVSYEGRKLGRCDGAETNIVAQKMMADANKQMEASNKVMAEQCRQFAAEATSPQVMREHCKDPADRKTFCAGIQTHDKFMRLADTESKAAQVGATERPLTESTQLCGLETASVRNTLCTSAEKSENLPFIASQCPAQATALAQRQCAGRDYTSMSAQYRDFCSTYAAANPAAETPASKTKGLFNKGKKALGGLLGN